MAIKAPSFHGSTDLPALGFWGRLHIDLPLLTGVTLTCGLGLLILFSAAEQDPDHLQRQVIRIAVAFAVMFATAQIPPARLRTWSPWLFVVGLLMLVAVLIVGEVGKGAQRWLDLGILRFQPSELVKLTVPMATCWVLAARPLPADWKGTLLASLVIAVPVVLIAKQPDLGTAILVGSAGIAALFLAGISWKLIVSLGVTVGALAPALWFIMLPYQRQRVLTFFDPERDPLGAGYHIIQSEIAIGSGGIYGKGWLYGTQSHLEFLPERTTDFIFSVLAEELGLIGTCLLMALYLFVVLRGLYIASQAQDNYGRLLAGSLILVFFVYLFVNIGMVSGLLPVVGVPLPLLSYGGTSLVTIMAAFGMLMSIHTHRKLLAA